MMIGGDKQSIRRNISTSATHPSIHLTCTDLGLKPGLLGEKPASNHFTFSECLQYFVFGTHNNPT
jgi:hypothetical protein